MSCSGWHVIIPCSTGKLANVTQVEKLVTDPRSSGHLVYAITSCVGKYKETEV